MDVVRFTKAFLDSFDFKRNHVTSIAFREWARRERKPPLSFPDRAFLPITKGGPAPRRIVVAPIEYINAKCIFGSQQPFDPESVIEACIPEPEAPDRLDATRSNFPRLLLHLSSHFGTGEAFYCETEEDVERASEMLMINLGSRNGGGKDRAAALALAEQLLLISPDAHHAVMKMLWRENSRSICFAPAPRRDRWAGASVVYPCSEDAYYRMRSGVIEFLDVAPSDIRERSDHIILLALTENSDLDLRAAKAERSMSQYKTLFDQIASLCLQLPGASPRILCFSPDAEGVERATSYGFHDVGTRTPRTHKTILEFCRPGPDELDEGSLSGRLHYGAMIAILSLLQAVQKARNLLG